MSDARDDIFPTARRPPEPFEPLEPAGAPAEPAPSSPQEPDAPIAESRPARDKVVLEFGSFREFIDDYSPYISADGMFLLDSPRRPGDRVAFEVRLSDDFRLIHGTGAVEWSVPASMPDHPAGAALRFSELDEPSRRLVERLVDNHRNAGGTPFDLDDRPPGATSEGAAAADRLPLPVAPGTETLALPTALAGALEDEAEPEDAGTPDTGEAAERPPLPIGEDLMPIPKADFDAARTQIVKLPEDFRLAESDAPADESGFEPAELPHVRETPPVAEPEEPLPVMPVGGGIAEDPLEAVDPDREAVFEVDEEAVEPAAGEDLAAEPTPATVEMPDETEVVADYYRSSGPPSRGRTFLWVALFALVLALGAAAWRYQDLWTGLLPESITGGGTEAAEPAAPPPPPAAIDAGAGPTDATAPAAVQPPAGEGETADLEPADEPAEPEAPEAAAGEVAPGTVPPAAADPPPSSPPAAGGPARVTDLSSRTVGEVTEVLIATDTPVAPDGFSVQRVAQPPVRQVIKIFGPDEPFSREAVAVGTEHVRRLRTGFHRVDGRGEVHVVADLTGPGVVVLGTELQGSMLIVRFGRR